MGIDRRRLYMANLRGGRRNPLGHTKDRAELVRRMKAHGVEAVIVDPFGRAYTGTSQNDAGEVQAFLTNLDMFVRAEVGARDLFLTVHAGWNGGERTRGSSAIEDWGDALVFLTKDVMDRRYLRAEGRDVELDEDALDYDPPAARRLTLSGAGNRKAAAKRVKADKLMPVVERIVTETPGLNWSALLKAVRAAPPDAGEFQDGGRDPGGVAPGRNGPYPPGGWRPRKADAPLPVGAVRPPRRRSRRGHRLRWPPRRDLCQGFRWVRGVWQRWQRLAAAQKPGRYLCQPLPNLCQAELPPTSANPSIGGWQGVGQWSYRFTASRTRRRTYSGGGDEPVPRRTRGGVHPIHRTPPHREQDRTMTNTNDTTTDLYERALAAEPRLRALDLAVRTMAALVRPGGDMMCPGCVWEQVIKPLARPPHRQRTRNRPGQRQGPRRLLGPGEPGRSSRHLGRGPGTAGPPRRHGDGAVAPDGRGVRRRDRYVAPPHRTGRPGGRPRHRSRWPEPPRPPLTNRTLIENRTEP